MPVDRLLNTLFKLTNEAQPTNLYLLISQNIMFNVSKKIPYTCRLATLEDAAESVGVKIFSPLQTLLQS